MATELSVAVVSIDNRKCQEAILNNYDVVIDTNKKAEVNEIGRWRMEGEAARRNVYLWGTDVDIDNAIYGIPGSESYLSIAESVDRVLGEITDENLEERNLVQHKIKKELNRSMNVQAQEWTTGFNGRPKVECRFGDFYCRDHHFETLTYYRSPIRLALCKHELLDMLNLSIYSDLHNIVQNTIYLIDPSFKVQCVKNKPMRWPIGIIFPYRTIEDYEEIKNENIFDDNYFTTNVRNLPIDVGVRDGVAVCSGAECENTSNVQVYHREFNLGLSMYDLYHIEHQDDNSYTLSESALTLDVNVVNRRMNGTLNNTLKKVILEDGYANSFQSTLNLEGKDADEIDKKYNQISDSDSSKWLDVKRFTYGYYEKNGKRYAGYGPLKVEGVIKADDVARMRSDDKMKIFTDFLDFDGSQQIDVNALCKLFGDFSRDNPNRRTVYIEDDQVCEKFRKTLNRLYNIRGEDQAAIDEVYRNGWTVNRIDVQAFITINNKSLHIYKRNIAKLGIILTSVVGERIFDDHNVHTIRGGFLLASSFYGNIYDFLKKEITWDVTKALRRPGWNPKRREVDLRVRPLIRMDVYNSIFVKGRVGICWQVYWGSVANVDATCGYPFFQEDIDGIQAKLNVDKLMSYNQQQINSEAWDDVRTELDDLLDDAGRFYNKRIDYDFYLDDRGILVTPYYYGQLIYYGIIANCSFKCVSTNTNRTTSDKNEFKHSAAQRLLSPNNWFFPFQEEYDHASICQGKALSTARQIRGRLERTYIDAIARDRDYREYASATEVDIIDNFCPVTHVTEYLMWRFKTCLYSIYVNHAPIIVREKLHKTKIAVYPNVQIYDGLPSHTTLHGIIYGVFITCYQARELDSDRDIEVLLSECQRTTGFNRLHIIKNSFPGLYQYIMSDDDNLDNYLVINFLFLLMVINFNSNITSKTYVPICYCVETGPIIISIKLSSGKMCNYMSRVVPYLSRFYGLDFHRSWKVNDDLLPILRKKAIEFYIGKCVVTMCKELAMRQTKKQNISMWVGSKCGGVSEAVLIFQAITYPKAGYVLLIFGDKDMDFIEMLLAVKKIFCTSYESNLGIIMCKIDNNNIIDVKQEGLVKSRMLRRNFWGLNHDMLLIKIPGSIFGNVHIVSKLMNI
uniref:Outer capsid protein VP2 n=1 Tax=Changuinola virus TaxID=40052 RepID=A0A3Q8AJH3_9REOV|nr:VP2 [Changuinola virus]